MSHDLRWIAPTPPEPDFAVLAGNQLTREFHEEIQRRHEFERYCQWYHATAHRHRREVQKMQKDLSKSIRLVLSGTAAITTITARPLCFF
ncbi:hypothetical protein [Leptolyngbya sp. Cla-17]|uniref:hypothetical protein n=1 Tax=Leptolyngbya sp. Cla-17 TaxID=2803751 RepID=UPI0018D8238D|nr:hypothetical protein [Leptolyngbya sp. Cla-17]